jgi:hypothetical protein
MTIRQWDLAGAEDDRPMLFGGYARQAKGYPVWA